MPVPEPTETIPCRKEDHSGHQTIGPESSTLFWRTFTGVATVFSVRNRFLLPQSRLRPSAAKTQQASCSAYKKCTAWHMWRFLQRWRLKLASGAFLENSVANLASTNMSCSFFARLQTFPRTTTSYAARQPARVQTVSWRCGG